MDRIHLRARDVSPVILIGNFADKVRGADFQSRIQLRTNLLEIYYAYYLIYRESFIVRPLPPCFCPRSSHRTYTRVVKPREAVG